MPRVLMGLMFYPRGGSAQVTRSLARLLPAEGWDLTIACGSLRDRSGHSDATRFFADLNVCALDYTEAAASDDPMAHDPPMHPSYEDRPGAADRVFAAVDDEGYERLVDAWAAHLGGAGAAGADVLHLHHLTPMNEAAARIAPDVPIVGHIHGTELLMLEAIDSGAPYGWKHADAWAQRMRDWADACEALILLSPTQGERVQRLLGVPAERCTVVPNGFDPEIFTRREIDREAHWREHLVLEPRGWRPGEEPGSMAYDDAEIAVLAERPVLLYVGRYTEVKRIGVLIRAFARAREETGETGGLVLLGGFPDEWEGEHPLQAVEAAGAQSVFLAGWHEHAALPEFFAASDVVVLASVREQFGQVLVEGMACGLPAIAVDAHGPGEIVADGETGWLVAPDDVGALAQAIAAAIGDGEERRRRGERAREVVRERYSWPALAERVVEVYEGVLGGSGRG